MKLTIFSKYLVFICLFSHIIYITKSLKLKKDTIKIIQNNDLPSQHNTSTNIIPNHNILESNSSQTSIKLQYEENEKKLKESFEKQISELKNKEELERLQFEAQISELKLEVVSLKSKIDENSVNSVQSNSVQQGEETMKKKRK